MRSDFHYISGKTVKQSRMHDGSDGNGVEFYTKEGELNFEATGAWMDHLCAWWLCVDVDTIIAQRETTRNSEIINK